MASTVHRQTLASSENKMSGIPVPSSVQKKPQPAPLRNSRMSIAGPPQRNPAAATLQVPGSSAAARSYHPSSQNNPNGAQNFRASQNSVRRDNGFYGRASNINGSSNLRMSTYGSRNRAGVLPHLPLPTKEARPVRDKAYQKKTQQAILDYLQDAQFQLPGLSIKTLQAPSVKEFQAIFKFLVHEIDPESEYKFLQHGKKFEDEFIAILKDLRYPHADQISKTALQAVNSPHSWPAILAALHWMVELSEARIKWLHHNVCDDIMVLPVEELPIDSDRLEVPYVINFNYLANTYKQFWIDGIDLERGYPEEEQFLEELYEKKTAASAKKCGDLEARIIKLRLEIEGIEAHPSPLAEIQTELATVAKHREKYEHYLEHQRSKKAKLMEGNVKLQNSIVQQLGYKAEQDALHADHVGDVQKQNLTPEDVERMKTDKETLSKAVEELRTKINESSKSMWDRELALAKRSDTVEQLVGDYMNLAYNTSMHPTPPPPFESINFALELNLATSNPRDMLKTNIRDTIKPALMAVVESKRQERAKVEDERVKTEDELDRIIQEADNVKEEINAVAHRLQVIQEQAEDVKTNAINEAAASNHEAHKLEEDVGRIATAVQQSELAAKSKLSALEVEYDDIMHKTNKLKEDIINEMVSQTQMIVKFKTDIGNKLDSLTAFAEQN